MSIVQNLRARLPQTQFVRRLAVIGGGTAIGQALSILASPLLGRLYQPADFGQLAIYGSLTAVLGVVAGFGYHLAVQTAESDEEAAELVVVALLGVVLTAIVGGIVMTLLRTVIERFLHQPGLSRYLWLVPLGVMGLASYEVVSQWATRRREFGVVGRTTAERSLMQVGLQLAGGFSKLGAMALIVAQLVGQWAGIYRVFGATMRPSVALFQRIDLPGLRAAAKRYQRFPLSVVPATLLYAVDANSAPLIFAHFFDGTVVGLYALSHRLIAVPLWLIGTSAQKVFFPAAAEAHRNARLRDETFDTFRQLLKLVLPGTLLLTLAGPELFAVVFGSAWREAGVYVQWLAPRTGLVLLAFPLVPIVYVLDRQWVNTVFCALQLVLRVGGLVLGGRMGSARLGVEWLSVGTGALWFGYLFYLMALSGNGPDRVLKPLLKESLLAAALVVPLALVKLLHGSDLLVTLVACGTGLALAPLTIRGLSASSRASGNAVSTARLEHTNAAKIEQRTESVAAKNWLSKHAPFLVVVLVLLGFLCLQVSLGHFTRNDEILMKAPGREWAATGFWRNPEGTGHRHLSPPVEEVWMAHVPLHPFLYGLWVKVVGFGFTRNILFDALIHCALVLLVFALARLRGRELSPWFATAAALLITVIYNPGRPDEMVTCFGLLAYLALRNAELTPKRLIYGGLFLGLCAATHPVGTLQYAVLCSIALLNAADPLPPRIRRVAVVGLLSTLIMVGSVTPILILHPTAWHQFLAHVGQQMHPSYGEDLHIAWRDGRSYLYVIFGCALLGVADLVIRKPRFLDWLERYGIGLAFTLLLVARLPRHPYYFWYVPPLLVPAAVATIGEVWARKNRLQAYALAGTLLAFGGLGALDYFKELVLMAALPPEQRPQPNADMVRRLLRPGAIVASPELWSELGNEYSFRSPNHDPLPLAQLDYVMLFPTGQRKVGEASKIPGDEAYFAQNYRLIYDNLPRARTKVFGLPASGGFWGFGPRIYANTTRISPLPAADTKSTE